MLLLVASEIKHHMKWFFKQLFMDKMLKVNFEMVFILIIRYQIRFELFDFGRIIRTAL